MSPASPRPIKPECTNNKRRDCVVMTVLGASQVQQKSLATFRLSNSPLQAGILAGARACLGPRRAPLSLNVAQRLCCWSRGHRRFSLLKVFSSSWQTAKPRYAKKSTCHKTFSPRGLPPTTRLINATHTHHCLAGGRRIRRSCEKHQFCSFGQGPDAVCITQHLRICALMRTRALISPKLNSLGAYINFSLAHRTFPLCMSFWRLTKTPVCSSMRRFRLAMSVPVGATNESCSLPYRTESSTSSAALIPPATDPQM